jgi:hypothetical protein
VREADPWLKAVLARETPTLTRGAVVFTTPQHLPAKELRPDGMLLTTDPGALADLPPPWSLLQREAVFEGKMPRDHPTPGAFQRLCFRREARQAQRILEADDAKEDFDHDPNHCAAWLLAPHVPEWVPAWERAGWARFEARGEGCWRVGPFPYPVLWIAANELPLREELIPFLAARSGKKLEDFVRWIGTRRSPAWLAEMVRSLPEVTTMLHVAKSAWPPEVLAEMADNIANSDIGKDILARGRAEERLDTFDHLYALRLGRPVTPAERATLRLRLDTSGPERVGAVVLQLAPDALAAWLADPNAT